MRLKSDPCTKVRRTYRGDGSDAEGSRLGVAQGLRDFDLEIPLDCRIESEGAVRLAHAIAN
jgi:hypothetical protein